MESEKLAIILRQTSYTENEAKERLDALGGDTEKVVREYLCGSADIKETAQPPASLNQRMYSEIRNYLDTNSKLANTGGLMNK